MSCTTNCEAGFYLDVDLQHKRSKCKECPQNYYSVGGGSLYSGQTKIWADLPGEFYTDCVVQHHGSSNWYHGIPGTNNDCSQWVAEANGTMISSGDNSESKTGGNFKTVSILYLNANFVKDGNVTYRFKVEAESDPNYVPGMYSPMFDGMYFVEDVNLRTEKISNTDWVQVTLQIEKGSHTLKWEYEKDSDIDFGADRAWIKDIQVYGTAWADTRCLPCSRDWLDCKGCRNCPAGKYKADDHHTCTGCPTDPDGHETWSRPGAVKASECYVLRKCGTDDLMINVTSCFANSHTTHYRPRDPHSCTVQGTGFVNLKHTVSTPCPSCDDGWYDSNTDGAVGPAKCRRCPHGKYSRGGGAKTCTGCPAGKYSELEALIGQGSEKGQCHHADHPPCRSPFSDSLSYASPISAPPRLVPRRI
jgi:hypothetical protein